MMDKRSPPTLTAFVRQISPGIEHSSTPASVLFCFFLSLTLMVVAVIAGYVLWLSQGCRPFMPLVSDFSSGASAYIFRWGLCSSAVLMLPVWYSYHEQMNGVIGERHPMLVKLLVFVGVLISVSLFVAGANRWAGGLTADDLHTKGFIGVLGFGLVFATLCAASKSVQGLPMAGHGALVFAAAAELALGAQFWTLGQDELAHAESITQLRKDYLAYCRGEGGSFHSNDNLNAAALCEWMLIASLLLITFSELQSTLWLSNAELEDGLSPRLTYRSGSLTNLVRQMTPGIENCETPREVLACLFLSLGIMTNTVFIGYLFWLHQGCRPFMPFISDFGAGASAGIFMWGTCTASVLMLPVWYNYYEQMNDAIGEQYPVLLKLLVSVGLLSTVGLFVVGANPMAGTHTENDLHTKGSIVVFVGGVVFVGLCAALKCIQGLPVAGHVALAVFLATDLAMGARFFFWGYADMTHAGSITLMQTDYPAYCRGDFGTFHSNDYLNAAAICEWILIGSLVIFLLVELCSTLCYPPQARSLGYSSSKDALTTSLIPTQAYTGSIV